VQAAEALEHAHQVGIVHRDIKPANLLVDGRGNLWVTDFGLAHCQSQAGLTITGDLVGTLRYMSPEQALAQRVVIDHRTDVYSLGVTLYELLTLRQAFEGKDRQELLRQIAFEEPPRPRRVSRSVPRELETVVLKAMEKNPADRYATAQELADDLERWLKDEPIRAQRPTVVQRLRRWSRRHRPVVAGLAAGLFLAVTVTVATIGWAVRDRAAREAEVERRAHDSLTAARSLIAENKFAAARQKLAEARAQLSNDRSALASLAAEVEAAEADLDRWQKFLDLIDRAHQAETAPVLDAAWAAGGAHGRAAPLPPARTGERRPAAAVPFLLEALHCYEILECDDWNSNLEAGLLGRDQVEQIRRTVYEELLWLVDDVVVRREEHRSGKILSPQGAARAALVYLAKAESAHQPTQAFYALRARCRKALGEMAVAQADQQRADKTRPTMAVDHYLRGQAAFDAKQLAEGIQAFKAGLGLEPTHYWCLMRLGYCLCDLGQGPEDFDKAALVFTGCILKRPEHAHAYCCRGHAYKHLGQHDKAIGEYQKAIQLKKDHERAHNSLGNALQEKGRLDEAIAAYREAIRLKPDYAEAHHNLGDALAAKGRLDEAIAVYREAIHLKKEFPEAHHNLGVVLWKKRRLDEAIAEWREAIHLKKDHPVPHHNLGLALLDKGRLDEAIVEFQEAKRLKKDDPKAHLNLGIALTRMGRLDKAIAAYREAIRLKKDYPEAHWNLGIALARQGLLDAGIAEYRTAIRLKEDEPESHTNLGNALAVKGCLDEAIAEFQEAIRLQKDNPEKKDNPEPHNGLGNVLYLQKRLDEAIAAYREAIRLKKDYPEAHYNLARALRTKGQLDEAIAAYGEAIRVKKYFPEAYNNLGNALSDKGRLDEAIAAYREAIRLKPDLAVAHANLGNALRAKGDLVGAFAAYFKANELKDAGAWINRGNAYGKLGQFDKAVAAYSKAIELDPKYAPAHNNLAWLLATCPDAKLRDPRRAVELAKRAVRLATKEGNNWGTLGAAHYRAGDWKEAVAALDKSRELKKGGDAYAWLFLAMAHQKLGNHDEARKAYDQATQWLEKNKESLAKNKRQAEELRRFRSETEEVLELKKK
jgi:tetratricopeptide (TPR) repeat protein